MAVGTIVNAWLIAFWNKRDAHAKPSSSPVKKEAKITGAAYLLRFLSDIVMFLLALGFIINFAASHLPMLRFEVAILALSVGILFGTLRNISARWLAG